MDFKIFFKKILSKLFFSIYICFLSVILCYLSNLKEIKIIYPKWLKKTLIFLKKWSQTNMIKHIPTMSATMSLFPSSATFTSYFVWLQIHSALFWVHLFMAREASIPCFLISFAHIHTSYFMDVQSCHTHDSCSTSFVSCLFPILFLHSSPFCF